MYWTLKPLFFEVPTGEPSAGFVGRQWLYREISEHLTSDLPTNRGVIVAGNPATGKTAAILQLVENRCGCSRPQSDHRATLHKVFSFFAVASGGEVGTATEN